MKLLFCSLQSIILLNVLFLRFFQVRHRITPSHRLMCRREIQQWAEWTEESPTISTWTLSHHVSSERHREMSTFPPAISVSPINIRASNRLFNFKQSGTLKKTKKLKLIKVGKLGDAVMDVRIGGLRKRLGKLTRNSSLWILESLLNYLK